MARPGLNAGFLASILVGVALVGATPGASPVAASPGDAQRPSASPSATGRGPASPEPERATRSAKPTPKATSTDRPKPGATAEPTARPDDSPTAGRSGPKGAPVTAKSSRGKATGWIKPMAPRVGAHPAPASEQPRPATPPRPRRGSIGVFASPSPGQPAPVGTEPVISGITEASGSLTVNWTEPAPTDPADYYMVTVNGSAGPAPCANVTWVSNKSSYTCTMSGLTNGTTYQITVRTYVGGAFESSQVWYATPVAATAPAAPVLSTPTVSGTTVTVTWTAPNNNGSAITGYTVENLDQASATGPACVPSPATNTTCTFTGVPGKTYTLRVQATNGVGAGPYGATQNAVVAAAAPDAPVGNTPTRSSSTVTFTWTAPANNGAAITGYSVENLDQTGATGPACTPSGTAVTCSFTSVGGKTYTLRVRATNSVGTGAYSAGKSIVVPATAPAAVTLNAPSVSGTTVTVIWSAPNNNGSAITGYEINNVDQTSATGPACTPSPATALTCNFVGVRGKTYSLKARATNSVATGAYGAVRTAAVPAIAPDAPVVNTPTVSGTTVTVTWAAPADNGAAITGYTVENLDQASAAGPACTPSPATATTCTFTGVRSKTYSIRVLATNSVGNSAYSTVRTAPVAAIAPDAPVVATPTVTGTTVAVSWTAPADNGAAITGYTVENLDQASAAGPACAPSPATATTCSFTGVRGKTYSIRVLATNSMGNGAYSTVRTAVVAAIAPDAPVLGAPTLSAGAVTVTWSTPANNGAAITGYTVENLDQAAAAGPACTPSPATATTCTFTGVQGKTYTMRVRATNSAGTSSYSNSQSINVPAPPDAPVLNTPTLSGTTVTATWTTAANNGAAISAYQVEVLDGASPGPTCTPSPATGTSCAFTGAQGKTYTVRVRATNSAGAGAYSNTQTINVPAPPDAPVLSTPAYSGTTITATWTAPANNGAPVTGYQVEVLDGASPGPTCAITGTSCSFTGTPGKTYSIRVRATNSAGTGSYSATRTIRIPWPVTAPGGVAVTPYAGALYVTWSMADTTDVTGFQVTATASGSSGACAGVGSDPSARSCRVTGLADGLSHAVRVTAIAGNGRDDTFADATGTPAALPVPVVTLTRGTRNLVVAWTFGAADQSRITGFQVTAAPASGASFSCAPQAADVRDCTVTGLADSTPYTVTVTALARSGAAADNVAGSSSMSTATVPDAPTLNQPQAQDTAITATWTPNGNGGAPLTGYEVEVARTDAAGTLTCVVDGTSCAATGVRGATYSVRVRARNEVGPSPWTAPASVGVPALAPAAPVLGDLTRNGTVVSAAWTPGADNGAPVTGYTVTVSGSGGDTPACAPAPATATACQFTGVRGGTYTVSVTASNAKGASVASNQRQLAVPATVPTPVVTVKPGAAALLVAWQYPAGAEGQISGFTVVVKAGAVEKACATVLTPSTRSCRIDGLDNGTAYTATVTAVATGGDRADDVSGEGSGTPATLAVTAVTVAGPGTLTIRWTFPSGDETRIDGFRVTATGSAGPAACAPAPLAVTARTCRITGLTNSVEYTVTVRALSPTGDDRDDATSTATAVPSPLPLTGPQVDPANGGLDIDWTYPADGEDLITGFRVTAAAATGPTYECEPQPVRSARDCFIGGLTNGTLYTVTVIAVAASGFPDDNAWGSAAGRPSAGAPSAPTAVSVSPGNATARVSWGAPARAGQGVAGYEASAVPQNGGPAAQCRSDDAAVLTCALSALTNGVTYAVRVTAIGVDGESPPTDPVLATPAAPVTIPATPPAVVQGTLASSTGATFPTAGRETILTGSGFAPNTPVQLVVYSTPTVLGSAVTDDTGTFRQAVTIPAGLRGSHTVVSIGLDPSGSVRVLSLAVQVGKATSGSRASGGGLAITGLPVAALTLTGLALVAAGAASRVAGRVPTSRRQRARAAAAGRGKL